jgi:cytochrome P450
VAATAPTDLDDADLEAFAAYIRDPSCLDDPHPLLHAVRARAAVHWNPHLSAWAVLSYDAAAEVLRDSRMSRAAAADRQTRMLALGATEDVVAAVNMFGSSLMMKDGEDHTRLRRLIVRAFTPRAISAWRSTVEQAADEILDGIDGRDTFDFVTEFAYPLPERVICRLLGVPYEDHRLFTEWDTALTHSAVYSGQEEATDHTRAAQRALVGYRDYFDDLIATRRRQPAGEGTDLLTLLVEAEDSGDRLTHDELIGTLVLLILAGHHTTANLFGNGMLGLLRHPDQLRLLQSHPELMPLAVEELLRYDSSARGQLRVAIEPTTVGGHDVAPGQVVMLVLHAVNRDPAKFADPDRLDLRRDPDHLAFAAGAHYCVGASLARLEGQVGFAKIAERLADVELATTRITSKPTFGRAAAALPLRRVTT